VCRPTRRPDPRTAPPPGGPRAVTDLRPWAAVREHPIAVAVVVGVIAVQAAWMAGAAVCPRMTMTECVVAAIVLVAGASVLGIAIRVGWLAATTTRALRKLPRVG